MEANPNLYCHDLLSKPLPENRILVTGATGFIGGELIPELVARGYRVRLMVRTYLPKYKEQWPSAEIIVADALDYTQLKKALEGVHCAYYLIHSLNFADTFQELDLQAARNFRMAAEENNLKRIIYLGSLGNPESNLSDHLRSRIKVAEELQKGKTLVTFLRAAIIIGSGSASYKIIHHLVRNCPIFLLPVWANSQCQPIAICDVIKYLVACMELEETTGETLDIGGQDILTYRMMLEIQAEILNKKRLFINTACSLVPLYARIINLLTPVSHALSRVLVASCKNDVLCFNTAIKNLIPFQTLTYSEALLRALPLESQKRASISTQALVSPLNKESQQRMVITPPIKSRGFLSDIRYFLLHKPEVPTLIHFNSILERENYTYRILQRLGVEVSSFKILNIHKIGINAPAKYIFEELLQWDGDSSCWPNHIAKVVSRDHSLEKLYIYLFGWVNFPSWIKNSLLGRTFIPLFMLNAITIKRIPDSGGYDNARYLLYNCSGGYPIGVFTMYVRSSITEQEENEQSQLFLMVGFNFYGKEDWSNRNLINRMWEAIHNRVTLNVMHRFKQLCEWRFEKFKDGN